MSSKALHTQVAQQSQFYASEQAIILDSIEGTSIQAYIVEIGNLLACWISDLYL